MPQKTFPADTGAGVLSAWETGDGPPLLLLHGPGLSDDMSRLGAETAGWRSIAYQQRGIAPSATGGPFTDVQPAADAVALRAPAVFVPGEQSLMPLSQNQQTAALLPDAEVVMVPGSGHLPWHERPGCAATDLAAVQGRAST